jgi:hypothetical protein
LIDDSPVQSYVLDSHPELVEVDRFLNIAVRPQVVAAHQVPFFFGVRWLSSCISSACIACVDSHTAFHELLSHWNLASANNCVHLLPFRDYALGEFECSTDLLHEPVESSLLTGIVRHLVAQRVLVLGYGTSCSLVLGQ